MGISDYLFNVSSYNYNDIYKLSFHNLDIDVQLLYTTTNDIVLLDTGTGVTTNITEGNDHPWYIDYNYITGYIYWSNGGTISRYISVVSLLLLQLNSFMSNR